MKSKARWVAIGTVVFALAVGVAADAQLPKQGKYRGMFSARGAGTVHEVEKGHVFFVGEFSGVFFNDLASRLLHRH
jgi:hypothetical protein